MNDERKPWDQLEDEGESSLWYGRFRAYLLMGFKRSVNAVFQQELEERGGDWRDEAYGSWYDYAKKYRWDDRVAAYDAHWIEEQDKLIAQEREVVIRTGFALQHKRIEALNSTLEELLEMKKDHDKVWLPDVKAIGNGPNAERVDLVNFNAPLFTLIEKYANSIAAEMGERVKRKDITVTELPPNVYLFDPDDDGSVIQAKEGEEDERA
ncbi:MAG TPA: hypothetical protein VHV10_16375 [Ktedonobacteraceae bacterium]|nr:hypothetical protein [Ktedonobacteraceae bacterium]